MKRSTKYILSFVGLFVVILIGVVGYGAYWMYSTLTSFSAGREMPDALKEARVTIGGEFLHRSEIFKLEKSGWLTTILDSTKIADEKERERFIRSRTAASIYNFSDLKVFGYEIIAAGEFGAYVFDLQGNLKRHVAFEPAKEHVKIGPIETDTWSSDLHNLTIVRLDADTIGFSSWGISEGMRVFDSNGNEIWTTGKEILDIGKSSAMSDQEWAKLVYVMQAAVGDLDGDGVAEYIVAKKNDGIRVFDRSGKERWFHEDKFPSKKLDVFDLDGDGRNELIVLGKAVFDGQGKIIRENSKSHGEDGHVFSEIKTRAYEINFADTFDGRLTYKSENGEELFSAEAPLSEIKLPTEPVNVSTTPIPYGSPGENMASAPGAYSYSDSESVAFPRAALVTLRKGEPKYLAVIASFIGIPRSNFYVYDQNGNLVYHELLPEDAETIAVLPADGGVESILIGGKDTIWKYSVK